MRSAFKIVHLATVLTLVLASFPDIQPVQFAAEKNNNVLFIQQCDDWTGSLISPEFKKFKNLSSGKNETAVVHVDVFAIPKQKRLRHCRQANLDVIRSPFVQYKISPNFFTSES